MPPSRKHLSFCSALPAPTPYHPPAWARHRLGRRAPAPVNNLPLGVSLYVVDTQNDALAWATLPASNSGGWGSSSWGSSSGWGLSSGGGSSSSWADAGGGSGSDGGWGGADGGFGGWGSGSSWADADTWGDADSRWGSPADSSSSTTSAG
ncbi:hypothetical protein DFH08DRAFT_823025 [Mycena albidolilacea]|uniref:Uncharacterized protein n=1 Tax=Mycena albidolilacea TaxID=1033008 RepID=A0AAD7ECG0_9AGAR|nr:hypothetical protein DFH08DRAFT_823025 [Mycena albidolilacea]